jgi:hemoglobin-like flavoprotein
MGGAALSKPNPDKKAVLPTEECKLLESSWVDIETYGPERVGIVMFKRLFAIAPETFKMFTSFCDEGDWENNKHFLHHCRVVVAVIGSTIATLDKPELINHHMGHLGFRHAMRESVATSEHFALLGDEFLKALEEILGPDKWNPSLRTAWSHLYVVLSSGIQEEMKMS